MLEQVQKMLAETFPDEPVTATADERNIVTLTGECSTWQTVINVAMRWLMWRASATSSAK